MAEFTEILKIRKRMCESIESCNDCHLHRNKQDVICDLLLRKYPEEYEQICLDWAKENPEITNADKFKEIFGLNENPSECPFNGSAFCIEQNKCKECEYKNFWNKPYIEPKEKQDG